MSCFTSSIHRLQQIVDLTAGSDGILIRPQDIMQVPRSQLVAVVSGSQGEPMSALARVAVDNHRHLSIERGADVIYGVMNAPLHVSGHASAEELKLILNLVRPKYFVPIHGEYRQLAKHASLAEHLRHAGLEETFILETGETLELDGQGARKGERVPVGRICIDSGTTDEVVEDLVIRDRRHLSEDGFLLPIIAIDKHTGKAEGLPEIVTRGFVFGDEGSEILQAARQVVARTLESSSAEERSDSGVMKEKIRTDLKRFLSKQTSRHPLIMPVILEI